MNLWLSKDYLIIYPVRADVSGGGEKSADSKIFFRSKPPFLITARIGNDALRNIGTNSKYLVITLFL